MLLKCRLISGEVAPGAGWVVVSSLLVSIPISLPCWISRMLLDILNLSSMHVTYRVCTQPTDTHTPYLAIVQTKKFTGYTLAVGEGEVGCK